MGYWYYEFSLSLGIKYVVNDKLNYDHIIKQIELQCVSNDQHQFLLYESFNQAKFVSIE